jgi:hypothetical protein
MCQPGRLRAFQRGREVRCPGRQNGQSFVEVAVCGGGRQAIVAGELGKAGVVDEPAQDEPCLPEAAQRTPAPAGSGRDAVVAQQPGLSAVFARATRTGSVTTAASSTIGPIPTSPRTPASTPGSSSTVATTCLAGDL